MIPKYFSSNVQEGLEIGKAPPSLFSLTGSRWSGHIALPGGKREVDETDLAAAIRETEEEVGINLHLATYGGKLPERLVTTWGGQVYV